MLPQYCSMKITIFMARFKIKSYKNQKFKNVGFIEYSSLKLNRKKSRIVHSFLYKLKFLIHRVSNITVKTTTVIYLHIASLFPIFYTYNNIVSEKG